MDVGQQGGPSAGAPDELTAPTAAESMRGTKVPGGQPSGLWVLFITEMWERFSYYGMRALLVLYLITSTTDTLESGQPNPGFGWSEEHAQKLYAWYTMAVYLTPLAGGWLADKFLGTHRSMLIGGWIIAAGHVTLALTEFFGVSAGEAVTLQTSPGALLSFITGLALIVIGTGFFKPCVSVMVGQLYGQNDPRRDSGFTIFYMGINLGAFLSPLVAGTLGEKVGWHWGFGSAAVGMVLGLLCYQFLRPKFLAGVGLPPKKRDAKAVPTHEDDAACPECNYSLRALPTSRPCPECGADVSHIDERTRSLTIVDLQRIAVIAVLAFIGNIFFWTAFEQAGTSMTVFADKNTDLTLWGLLPVGGTWFFGLLEGPIPASWYQSVNPLTILLFGSVFSVMWVWLERKRLNPSAPMKFAIALWLLGLAFIAMVFGAMDAESAADGKAGPHWLLITYVTYTWAELCLSPVGLSMVTKLSPKRLQSLMMGVWFLTNAIANFSAGWLAAYSHKFIPGESGKAEWTFIVPGLPGFFLLLVVSPIAAGLLIAALSPVLRRWMHGVK